MDQALLEGFESVCEWLEKEGDCELHTIKELQGRMKDSSKTEAYSAVYMKKKLKSDITVTFTLQKFVVLRTLSASKKWQTS